jgi:hemerythrin
MAVIKWRDSYNTGVEAVDLEHRKLVTLIEAMHTSIRDKEPKDSIERVVNEIVDYTQSHFVNEELLMHNEQYPQFADHKVEHQNLIEEVDVFKERLLSNFPDGRQDLYRFLREWLINHILESDKKFAAYVAEKS